MGAHNMCQNQSVSALNEQRMMQVIQNIRLRARSLRMYQNVRFLDTVSLQKAELRDKELRERHLRYLDDYDENIHRKKLIYRAKQRGWLEVDLLMGTWAEENIPHLSSSELADFERILNLETIEIFYAISKPEDELPQDIKSSTLTKIREFALRNPFKINAK